MRKIPDKYENPIDNVFLNIADKVQSKFYENGFTPNMVTTLSLLCIVVASALLFKGQYILAAILILLGYFFDCLDGHLARTYNMVSSFGDYYDHISDICKVIILMVTFFILDCNKFYRILPYAIAISAFMLVHLGCQEIYYTKSSNTNGDSLSSLKVLCPSSGKHINSVISYTRFFGCGTANLFLALVAIYYGC